MANIMMFTHDIHYTKVDWTVDRICNLFVLVAGFGNQMLLVSAIVLNAIQSNTLSGNKTPFTCTSGKTITVGKPK